MTDLFVTGGTGFIGSCLIARLRERGHIVRALTRSKPVERSPSRGGQGAVIGVPGDLLDPDSYRQALETSDAVVHLAALTGQASRAEHNRTNVIGTERLVAQARKAGVSRLLFVSSIVAKFADRTRYPYAEAKARAEDIVRAGGLPFTIIRPTIVIGPGSPNLKGLQTLACAPVILVFGDGAARVQPIYLDDLVEFLVRCVDEGTHDCQVLELGGPEVVSVQDLLKAIRTVRGGGPGRVLHIPLGAVAAVASALEALINPRYLWITAGRLSVFAYDTTAEPNALHRSRADHLRGVREMLELSMKR